MPFSKNNRSQTFSGILFVALFALASLYIAENAWVMHLGLSSLVIAIVMGIFYGNTLHHRLPKEWIPGILFSGKQLLRLAIILYGFRITFQEIVAMGVPGLLLDLTVVSTTLILGIWVGVKIFKLDRHLSILISAGAAICGAAAVLAVEDVLKSAPHKTSIAIGTVVLFGTFSMFLYPFLLHAGIFTLTHHQFGLFAGASIHEVAQVVVASNNISQNASDIAVVVKMTRVLLIVPALLFLSIYESCAAKTTQQEISCKFKLNIPWFAIIFVGTIGIHSLHWLPVTVVNLINQFDTFLLTMAMAAIGMETHFSKIKKVGLKPLYLAIVLFLWLTGLAYGFVQYL